MRINKERKYFLKKVSTWQTTDRFLLVGTLLREPQVVEPLDDFDLEVARHAAHPHVRLHSVQFRCNSNNNIKYKNG